MPFPDFGQLICIGFASGLLYRTTLPLVSTKNLSTIKIGKEKEFSCLDQLPIQLSLSPALPPVLAGRQLWSSLKQGAQPLFSRVIYISAKPRRCALGRLASLLAIF
jgi:hypothetical protein